MVESNLLNGHVPSIFIWSFKFIHEWGEKINTHLGQTDLRHFQCHYDAFYL